MKIHYKMFWGCTIPAQLPFIEKSTREVLDHFKVLYSDLEGTTCCPEKLIAADDDHEKYVLTAARNLALAEKEGKDVLVICNGCYATLKTVRETLKTDPAQLAAVNEKLAKIGLHYTAARNVHHILGVIENDIRTARVRKEARRPLAGLRVAVHYGCNMLRPSSAIQMDDPMKPEIMDRLVEALGGVSVDYGSKMACCGGNFSLMDGKAQSDAMLLRKVSEARAAGADCLLVACPACFTQFDFRQDKLLRDQGRPEDALPVLHLSELIALVLGYDLDENAMKRRRVKLEPLLEKWSKRIEIQSLVAKDFDIKSLARCASCGACMQDCPVTLAHPDFNPNEIVKEVLAGKVEEVLAEGKFWNCLDCLTCYELCPQRFGMQSVFSKLKELAGARGQVPETLARVRQALADKGRVAEGSPTLRKRLNLPDLPKSGEADLKALLGEDDKK